jgi:CRP-like cAMP-binding protein
MVSCAKTPLTEKDRMTLDTRGWLSAQPSEFRAAILAEAQSFSLADGENIYRLEDAANGLFAVCEGFVNVLIAPHPNAPQLVHVAREGWWVGDAALITDSPRRADLTARTSTRVAYVPREAILRICEVQKDGWRTVAKLTVSMMDHAITIMSAQKIDKPQDRMSAILLALVGQGQLYGRGGETDPVEFPLNQWDIAELAGLSRNAAGNVLRQLQSKGAIELEYRRLKILDRRLL